MRGFLLRFIKKFTILNSSLLIAILSIVYVVNSESLSHYSIKDYLLHSDAIFREYIFESQYSELFLYSLVTLNIYLLLWSVRNYRYLNLPYAVGLFNQVKQFEGFKKRTKIYFDKFIKKKKYRNGNFSLYFKNWVSISPKNYEENKILIAQYLRWDGDIKVFEYKNRGVELYFYKLPIFYTTCIYKFENIHFGKSIDKELYIPFDELTHTVVVGESGSGKSNFMHHILQSMILNKEFIENIELIDLKGTELYFYKDYNYMHFTDEITEVRDRLKMIRDDMKLRFEVMKANTEQLSSEQYKFVIIDEIGTIGTCPDKKLRDEIFNLMIEISQKGRAAKILLFIFAQKIDGTNISSNVLANLQTKVLMKTDSDFNVNNTIGKKEDLEKITLLDVDSFPKGRAIVKNGYTSDKYLVQVPYIDLNEKVA